MQYISSLRLKALFKFLWLDNLSCPLKKNKAIIKEQSSTKTLGCRTEGLQGIFSLPAANQDQPFYLSTIFLPLLFVVTTKSYSKILSDARIR